MTIDISAAHADSGKEPPLGLYLHIPFCEKKCPYCDFNTYAGLDGLHASMVDALCAEMVRWREALAVRTITSIFIGGGTPTVLDEALLERLLAAVYGNFRVDEHAEITSEANPGTVDQGKFGQLRSLGVNRLSMGVQSFQPEELRFLGRIHDVQDVLRAYELARAAGFDNLNLDFIFGLPNQSERSWQATLDMALELAPEHLSLYSLIVEQNTPLFHWVESGHVAEPDEDQAALLYEIAMARLADAGYVQYEVSNWYRRKPVQTEQMASLASQHNLLYWRNGEYLGIGPGAHSHLRDQASSGSVTAQRWGNCKPPRSYIRRIETGQAVEADSEEIDTRLDMGETMMLGLRLLNEGVRFTDFQALHGATMQQVFTTELSQLRSKGLIELSDDRVRLTRRGLMVGNQVFMQFLPDDERVPAH